MVPADRKPTISVAYYYLSREPKVPLVAISSLLHTSFAINQFS
jgi:hypothetical protein